MRRIFSILIIILFGFLCAMLIIEPLRALVFSFILGVIGPTAYNAVAGTVNGILSMVGLLGFAGIIGIIGLIGGVLIHWGWVKTDWTLRRWGSQRIAQDLGAAATTSLPSTPVGATVRPAATIEKAVTEPKPEPTKEAAEETKT